MNETTTKRINIGEYNCDICYQTISEGEVIESSSDRVGIISGSAYGSVTSNISGHSGQVNGDVSGSFSFTIKTTVDVRHEFWIKCADGIHRQFVMPAHLPLIKGQKISLRQVYFKYEIDTTPQILMIELINFNTHKIHHYSLMGGGFVECTLSDINNSEENKDKNFILALMAKHPFLRKRIHNVVDFPLTYRGTSLLNASKFHRIYYNPTTKIILFVVLFYCGYMIAKTAIHDNDLYENIAAGFMLACLGVSKACNSLIDYIYKKLSGFDNKFEKYMNDTTYTPASDASKFIINQLTRANFHAAPRDSQS